MKPVYTGPIVETTASAIGNGEIMLTTRDGEGDVACVHLSMADVTILIGNLKSAVLASLADQRFARTIAPEPAQ